MPAWAVWSSDCGLLLSAGRREPTKGAHQGAPPDVWSRLPIPATSGQAFRSDRASDSGASGQPVEGGSAEPLVIFWRAILDPFWGRGETPMQRLPMRKIREALRLKAARLTQRDIPAAPLSDD